MRWRLTLTHAIEGTVTPSEFEGLTSAIIGLSRHPMFHTLVKEFKTPFRAYGSNGTQDGRRDWLKNIEATYGPDSVIGVTVEYAPDNYTFEVLYTGEVGIQTFIEGLEIDHYLEFTPVQNGMWRNFVSRFDVPVNIQSDLSLDGASVTVYDPETLNLPSQIINKETLYTGTMRDPDTMALVKYATTANITLSGLQTIDGGLTVTGDRVGVKDQSDATENGVYNASSGAWTRATDNNTDAEMEDAIFTVQLGTVNKDKIFKQRTASPVIGTDDIDFTEYLPEDDFIIYELPSSINIGFLFYLFYTPFVNQIINEINDSFSLPYTSTFESTSTTPVTPDSIVNVIEVQEDYGLMVIDYDIPIKMRADFTYTTAPGPVDSFDVTTELYFKKNNDTPEVLDSNFQSTVPPTIGELTPFSLTGTHEVNVQPGDIITIYVQQFIEFPRGGSSGTLNTLVIYGGVEDSNISFFIKSTQPDTEAPAFTQHDVAAMICDRITEPDKFYAPVIGSEYTKARVYDEAGSWWNNLLLKGVHARGYTLAEKLFSMSMKDWWEGHDPMFNSSLGYETIDGVERIVLRTKAEAYDSSSMSVLLSGVQRIKRKYGPDYFNGTNLGASKGKTEDISGIDDPQKTTSATILKNIGRVYTYLTNWIFQGLTIEQARRTTRIKSADYKFDDDTFVIESTRTGDGQYSPRLNEDFTAVTNLLNEETRYNKHHTPQRFKLRWLNYLSGGLQKYLGTVFRFTGGEGNYDMTSTMVSGSAPDDYDGNVLAENADILVGTIYLWIPKIFEIDHYLTFDEFKTIDENRNLAIGISQTDDDHEPFFIDDLQFEIMSGMVRITGKFKNEFDIVTVPPGSQIFGSGRTWDETFDSTFGDAPTP